ncbi:MAG: glucose-6-phosphate isomerase [Verrucomicrobiae bacterium]|nr:glucose-6-phosphate isomerase [Verrucomicrobiae bacterium]
MEKEKLWLRFQKYFLAYEEIGFSLDISRMNFEDSFFERMEPKIARAYEQMKELEVGAVANPDENREVGHYWLRNSSLAPDVTIKKNIEETKKAIEDFANRVHRGEIKSSAGLAFKNILLVGIGGSALGPQLMADALGSHRDALEIYFMDNTDPDGFDRIFHRLENRLKETLVIVISKSGGTKETRNGMLETQAFFEKKGVAFAPQAVVVTGEGSELDEVAKKEKWLARFPMWDWVGGRTSVMSAVGLLPAALQGFSIQEFLAGAAKMDAYTRVSETRKNAAMLLALMWYDAGKGCGEKDMVILPYFDRLMLFSKYLQQLVMESLGKEKDLEGKIVHQGIAVYGNKGSTDQHAYVQQLRDGLNNFFVTFIEVRKKRSASSPEMEPGVVSGDYLNGFLRGTRQALYERGRESITISIPELNAFYLGALIALFERAVGFYALLVNINAYHQPGVEAGKKAASDLLKLQQRVFAELKGGQKLSAAALSDKLQVEPEAVYHLLVHLVANYSIIQATHLLEPDKASFYFVEKAL